MKISNIDKLHGLLDQNGQPVALGALKVGDTVYKMVAGKLVGAEVTRLNPFTAQTNARTFTK